MDVYSIGAVSKITGYCAPTIRYFETIGLLPRVPRSAGGRRIYRRAHIDRLGFIRNCRTFGLAQADVLALVELLGHPEQPCAEATSIVADRLEHLRAQQRQLATLIATLEEAVDGCDGQAVSSCRIVSSLTSTGDQGSAAKASPRASP